MTDLARAFMKENFYYTYLRGRLEKGCESVFKDGVLIVGSSHAVCGIKEDLFDEAVNCSMHSQDIFYDGLCVRRVLDNISAESKYGICVVMMGYYMPFQDLSLSKYTRDAFISRTYYPIFHDAHNWEEPTLYEHWCFNPELSFEEKHIYEKEAVECSKYLPFYSDETLQRKPLFDFGGRAWKELSDEEKDNYGKLRAQSHNSLETHKESYVENLEIMKNLVLYLNEKQVKMVVAIAPFTEQYRSRVTASTMNAFFKMMKEANVPYVFDFNESCISDFDESDFQDMDHLNEQGSRKCSEHLAEMLKKL